MVLEREHAVPVMRCSSQSFHCNCHLGSITAVAAHYPSVIRLSLPGGALNMHFSSATQGAFVLDPPGHAFKYLDEEQLTQSWAGRCVVPADGFIHHTRDV